MKINALKMLVLMGKQEMNIGQLAKSSGVSRQTVSCIKSGKGCTPVVACKLAKALGVDVTEILEE